MSSLIEQIKGSFLAEIERILAITPGLIIGLIGFVLAWFIGSRVKSITKQHLAQRMDDPLLANFLARLFKVFIMTGGVLFFLKRIGWGDAAAGIMATAGVGAFVIGFALRDIGENFLAGIIMAFQRPFGVGDTIEVNGIVGVIRGLSLRETHIKTFDGKDVFVPNGLILKNPLFNYTIDGFMRKDIAITLDYDADVDRSIELVKKAIENIDGLLTGSKSPTISVTGIDLNGLQLKIFYWIDTDSTISVTDIRKEVIKKSVECLRKNGFLLPHSTIDLRNL